MSVEGLRERRTQPRRCPACHEDLRDEQPLLACPAEHAPIHADCAELCPRCPAVGCGALLSPVHERSSKAALDQHWRIAQLDDLAFARRANWGCAALLYGLLGLPFQLGIILMLWDFGGAARLGALLLAAAGAWALWTLWRRGTRPDLRERDIVAELGGPSGAQAARERLTRALEGRRDAAGGLRELALRRAMPRRDRGRTCPRCWQPIASNRESAELCERCEEER